MHFNITGTSRKESEKHRENMEGYNLVDFTENDVNKHLKSATHDSGYSSCRDAKAQTNFNLQYS